MHCLPLSLTHSLSLLLALTFYLSSVHSLLLTIFAPVLDFLFTLSHAALRCDRLVKACGVAGCRYVIPLTQWAEHQESHVLLPCSHAGCRFFASSPNVLSGLVSEKT